MALPDNNILDILISLVLIYALLSILVSILLEWWNHKKKARAKFLKKAIFQLLQDPLNVHFGELFYNHYLIEGFRSRELKTVPQYVSSQLFAEVLIDIIANRKLHDTTITLTGESPELGKQYEVVENTTQLPVLKRFELELMSLNPSPFTDTLKSFWQKSEGDYDKLKGQLSFWFDDYMDRVSGWYKTQQRKKILVFGFMVAIGLNVDSIHLFKIISLDDNLRNQLVATANHVADHYQALSDSAKLDNSKLLNTFRKSIADSILRDSTKKINYAGKDFFEKHPQAKKYIHLNDSIDKVYMQKADSVLGIAAVLDIPIGWNEKSAPLSWFSKTQAAPPSGDGIIAYNNLRNQRDVKSVLYYVMGIIISGVSLSFGAPFWFETLVKLINIRRAGKKPEAVNSKTKN